MTKERLKDLAEVSFSQGRYTFTHFLSLAEQDEFYTIEPELRYAGITVSGGCDGTERQMIRFGNPEEFGYEEAFPISCIHCRPMAAKFAEKCNHRDVLGALMHLGIEREVVGDIWVMEKESYFFCLASMKDFICDNLTKIRHTNVVCEEMQEIPQAIKPVLKREELVLTSPRCDAVVAKVFSLSRSKVIPLFREKKIFVGGRVYENNSGILKEDDVVSVRGYGKIIYRGVLRETKKGRYTIAVDRFV
ncbi:MAG: YlmH/Sll1252 family protein [Eubacterium sp.]|jgi:hypothetical protein|nr:YlmH/Sll1252 family protein [Roseburia sp.]PWM04591.1 MAG: hypothetical protein DBY03_03995 [Clostridiales bacterium]